MVVQLGILVATISVGVAIAAVLQKRKPDIPTALNYKAPTQLDPADFDISETGLTAIAFTSPKCRSCTQVLNELAGFDQDLSVINVASEENPDLLERYSIDGVPTTLLVDSHGVVLKAFFGFVSEDALNKAVSA